jgi:peptidoglycan/xylan/chitin deacetylase (PgdA/CDA1 family)
MKQQMLKLMQATGGFAPFRFANRGKALIVTYHRFTHGGPGAKMAAHAFAEQLDYLTRRYKMVSLSSIVEQLANQQPIQERIATITIDDGYDDAYEIAFPLLRARNVPAAMFVVTDFVDQKKWLWTDKMRYLIAHADVRTIEGTLHERDFHVEIECNDSIFSAAEKVNALLKAVPDDQKDAAIGRIALACGVELPDAPPPEYRSVSWDQIREMSDAGIEIGSHTATHPILPNIPLERARRELIESRQRITAETGRDTKLFCYPNGNYNDALAVEVERAGYTCAVTVEYGLNDEQINPFALKRIHAEYDMPHFIQSTSGFEEFKINWLRTRGQCAEIAAERQYELG